MLFRGNDQCEASGDSKVSSQMINIRYFLDHYSKATNTVQSQFDFPVEEIDTMNPIQ